MSSKNNLLAVLDETHIISVIRIKSNESLIPVMNALYLGGVKIIEITATTPNFYKQIKSLKKNFERYDDCFIGAGTILTKDELNLAIDSGSDFIVSPVFDEEIVKTCIAKDIPVIPGAMTPTEIFTAWKAGASIVKTFPGKVCNPDFYKDILGPFPNIKIMPTGNVNETTAPQYINSGAIAVGIGKALVNPSSIDEHNWKDITEKALAFSNLLKGL